VSVYTTIAKSILFSLAFLLLFLSFALAEDEPFTYPSNSGVTGLMEVPTARVLKENYFRAGISQVHPFRTYYVTFSPLPRLEINGRITEILGVKASDSPYWKGYGNYKDKAVDIKFQVLQEGKYSPALAIGIMDPHGTRLFAAQYLVFSKQIYPFDFTIGLGNGRFGKRPLQATGEGIHIEMFSDPIGWLKDSQLFGGVQLTLSEKLALMFEYNPIKYERQRDPSVKKYFQKSVPSKYNFGFRYKPWRWLEFTLSFQRGEEIGLNLSTSFELGKPMLPIYDEPYRENPEDKFLSQEKRILKALYSIGFSDIGIERRDSKLTIDFQNNRYFYPTRALGMALTTLAPLIEKENIEEIELILKETDIPLVSFTVKKEDLLEFYREKLTEGEFLYLSKVDTNNLSYQPSPKFYKRTYIFGYKPSVRFFLNDPSGFLKAKLGVSGWVSFRLWKGASLVAGLGLYPYSNISTVNKPLSIPVRTDIVDYLKKKWSIEQLFFQQIYRFNSSNLFALFNAGMLEMQYGGFDGEIAYPLMNGRFLVGLSGSLVKKRDPDNPFKFKKEEVKDWFTTAFVNARINLPEKEISFDVKYGRFLAGDVGVRFTVSKFINGIRLFAWYSFTDTSVFKDNINKGYHDKGIGIIIPIRLLKARDTRSAYGFAISPWTRDVAQDIDHPQSLFDFLGRNFKLFLEKDRKKMFRPD